MANPEPPAVVIRETEQILSDNTTDPTTLTAYLTRVLVCLKNVTGFVSELPPEITETTPEMNPLIPSTRVAEREDLVQRIQNLVAEAQPNSTSV